MNLLANSIEQGARLEYLMKSLNFKQLGFAKAIGVSQGFIAQVIAGKKNISYGTQTKLRNAFPELNIGWLLTGEGEMLMGKKPEAEAERLAKPQIVHEPGEETEAPALVVTDVTPLLRMMEAMREEMRVRDEETKAYRENTAEEMERLRRRVEELETEREGMLTPA